MPEDRHSKPPHSSRSSDNKKKKKKKKKKRKNAASNTLLGNTEKIPTVSLPPETLPVSPLPPQSLGQPPNQQPRARAASKKDGKEPVSCGRGGKKHPKDLQPLPTATKETSGSGVPAVGYVTELSAQARESLRWQGVLEDPQAEEKRLELYRANRRQRYISHRETLFKETQFSQRQTFPKESKEKKA